MSSSSNKRKSAEISSSTSSRRPCCLLVHRTAESSDEAPRKRLKTSASLCSIREEQIGSDGELIAVPKSPSCTCSEHDPETERFQKLAAEYGIKPLLRKKYSRSAASYEIREAETADPNHGYCLVTNTDFAVDVCHLLASRTEGLKLTRLEWAWGMKYDTLDADSPHNMLFLRADWHTLFDANTWMLIPTRDTLEELMKHSGTMRFSGENRVDINSIYTTETFEYFLFPIKKTPEICRYDKDRHTTIPFPHTRIGLLRSHVRPHFVVYNSARKLPKGEALKTITIWWEKFVSGCRTEKNCDHIRIIELLGMVWTLSVPPEFANHPRENEGKKFTRDGSNGREDSDESESASPASSSQEHGSRILVCTDSSSISEESIIPDGTYSDDALWAKKIFRWASKGAEEAQSNGGWETKLVNDKQVWRYQQEPVRDPPPADSWHGWRPSWKKKGRSWADSSLFSSNDWAAYRNNVYLTGA